MKANLLLDTNVVIYALEGKRHVVDLILDETIHLSFITEIELLSWSNVSHDDEKLISKFIHGCNVIEYSPILKEAVVKFRKKYNLRLPDAMIAATSFYYELPLISGDSIFTKIAEIDFFLIKP